MRLHDLIRRFYPHVYLSPGEVYVNCMFCPERVQKDDNKARLGINTATGIGNCHRCEKKHSAKGGKQFWFREICRVKKVDYVLSEEEKDNETIDSPVAVDKEVPSFACQLPKEYEPLWKNVDDSIGKRALNYLLDRGVTREQIKRHKVGFCAVGRYAYRVVIPVYSSKGVLKAFVARDFSGKNDLRYLNSQGAKTLYNVPRKKKKVAVLCEGIFDAWAFERCLFGEHVDAIAGLGKSLTKAQVRTLAKYESVYIWPDPNRPGVEGAIKRATALQKKKVKVGVVMPLEDLEEDTDLGAMPEYEISDRFKRRIPFTSSVAAIMRLRVAHVEPPKKKFTPKKVADARP